MLALTGGTLSGFVKLQKLFGQVQKWKGALRDKMQTSVDVFLAKVHAGAQAPSHQERAIIKLQGQRSRWLQLTQPLKPNQNTHSNILFWPEKLYWHLFVCLFGSVLHATQLVFGSDKFFGHAWLIGFSPSTSLPSHQDIHELLKHGWIPPPWWRADPPEASLSAPPCCEPSSVWFSGTSSPALESQTCGWCTPSSPRSHTRNSCQGSP